MIINVRGTSGSGKSELVRRIMALHPERKPHFVEGRKQPLFYECNSGTRLEPLFVLGHYETPCGGCDTISKDQFDTVFGLVRELSERGHVLFEGLLVSAERKRSQDLFSNNSTGVIIQLTTSLEDCIAGIQARRKERGDERPINPKNTEDKHREVPKVCWKLEGAKANVLALDREAAFEHVRKLLGV